MIATDKDSELSEKTYMANSAWDVKFLQQDTVTSFSANNTNYSFCKFVFEFGEYIHSFCKTLQRVYRV